MKYLITTAFFTFFFHFASAQFKHDYVWVFGYNFDSTFPGAEGVFIDFNQKPPETALEEIQMNISKTNASVSDTEGNLLFYTNGCFIADATHNVMENGDSINPGEVHDIQCEYGYTSGTQSCLILPMPQHPDIYYLFHKHIVYWQDPWDVATDALLYTVVDMSLNNGLGAVTEKNQAVINDTISFGELTAIKHANGRDWWLITQGYFSNLYHTVLFTPTGIESINSQDIGDIPLYLGGGSSQVVFSPDGTRFARKNSADQLWLFDFDRSSGLLSNFQKIWIDSFPGSGGVAFSPNSRFLYVTTGIYLYQFDTEAADIEASKILIDTWDGYGDPLPATFYKLLLGPDCRIYINSANTVKTLHVIQYPDLPGQECQFMQHAFDLPSKHFISMPNFPYYRMDTGYPICDTSLIVSSSNPFIRASEEIRLFPNPANSEINIALPVPLPTPAEWRLYNTVGQMVQRSVIPAGQREQSLSLTGVPPGLYFWQVRVEGRQAGSGKVVVVTR